MIIAVDGPAASGKGTIARALAAHYGLPHLDTGLLYRAVAVAVLRAGQDPNDADAALAACAFDAALLNDPDLRSAEAGAAASVVSAHPVVRAALLQRQRDFANQPGGAVLDGRDIASVVAPDADVRLYVTADPHVRATRRALELQAAGHVVDIAMLEAQIRERDARDSSRPVAPLVQHPLAARLDTSALDRDAAIAAAIALAEAQRASAQNP